MLFSSKLSSLSTVNNFISSDKQNIFKKVLVLQVLVFYFISREPQEDRRILVCHKHRNVENNWHARPGYQTKEEFHTWPLLPNIKESFTVGN
jgi:hypothetical protein